MIRYLFTFSILAGIAIAQPAPDAATLFSSRCATCHQEKTDGRIPTRADLGALTPDQVATALQRGKMTVQAAGLSDPQIRAIAQFIAKAVPAAAFSNTTGNRCAPTKPFSPGPGDWNGWGVDSVNSRYQPQPGLKAEDVPKLKLKWAFGFPTGDVRTVGQPSIVSGRVFVGSYSGNVYSLDAATGCTYWTYDAGGITRTAISIVQLPGSTQWIALFGDGSGNAHAVDALTGQRLWKIKLDDNPVTRITGAPTYFEGRVYVPVSSGEEIASNAPKYECCTFQGSLVALDAKTGEVIWKTYTIPDRAKQYKTAPDGTPMFGPAGASLWSAPTIDAKRRRIYIGSGNSYTNLELPTSDAILAFDLDTGSLLWSNQLTPHDNWVPACPRGPICPEVRGDDYDFAASVVLKTVNGKAILLAAQKSGTVYALDPNETGGKLLWKTSVGKGGGLLGGIGWGLAVESQTAYAAVADINRADGTPGLYAIRIDNGQILWSTPAPKGAGNTAQAAAVTAIPGIAFSGSYGGHMRAYSTSNGAIVWDYDANHPFETVNGVPAKGGSFNGGGVAVSGGLVITSNGFGFAGGTAGNVLLAFSVDGK